MLFVWDQSYDTGIEEIDRDHRGLVKLINDLYEAMQDGSGGALLLPIFSALKHYRAIYCGLRRTGPGETLSGAQADDGQTGRPGEKTSSGRSGHLPADVNLPSRLAEKSHLRRRPGRSRSCT